MIDPLIPLPAPPAPVIVPVPAPLIEPEPEGVHPAAILLGLIATGVAVGLVWWFLLRKVKVPIRAYLSKDTGVKNPDNSIKFERLGPAPSAHVFVNEVTETPVAIADANGDALVPLPVGKSVRLIVRYIDSDGHLWHSESPAFDVNWAEKNRVTIEFDLIDVGLAGQGKVWVTLRDGGQVNGAYAGKPIMGVSVTLHGETMTTDGAGKAGPWLNLPTGNYAVELVQAQLNYHDSDKIVHDAWVPDSISVPTPVYVTDAAVAVIEHAIQKEIGGDADFVLHVTVTYPAGVQPQEAFIQVFDGIGTKLAGALTSSQKADLHFRTGTGGAIRIEAVSLDGMYANRSRGSTTPQTGGEFSETVYLAPETGGGGGGGGKPNPTPEPTTMPGFVS